MATIQDVAKAAGVSTATVSYVINKTKHISPDTAKRVNDAIEALGYRINPIAKSLKSKRTNRLAFILSDVSSQFHSAVIRGITNVANDHGYNLSIYCCYSDMQKEWAFLEDARNNQVDGVILNTVIPTEQIPEYAEKLKALFLNGKDKDIPLVLLERDFSPCGLDSVFSDVYAGACSALEHLIDKGASKIAFVAPPANLNERIRAYHDTLARHGIAEDPSIIRTCDLSHISGYNAMKTILAEGGPIDAVFTCNDTSGVGALRALLEAGIKVPDEVKLMGFDDIFFSRVLNPSMSSVHIHKTEMGTKAAELLCGRLEHTIEGDARRVELPWELMVRHSSDPNVENIQPSDDW